MNSNMRIVVVTLTEDLPDRRLQRGQVGTVVGSPAPDVFEVQFPDSDGRPSATVPVNTRHLLVTHY